MIEVYTWEPNANPGMPLFRFSLPDINVVAAVHALRNLGRWMTALQPTFGPPAGSRMEHARSRHRRR